MALKELLKEKNISVYQCAKKSKVPYTTLADLVNGKTKLSKCTAETIYKLSKHGFYCRLSKRRGDTDILEQRMVSGKFLSACHDRLFKQGKRTADLQGI